MDLKQIHKHSIYNRKEIEQSAVCGCFYCLRWVHPPTIKEWCDDEDTAVCPHCSIDSLIGSFSGIVLSEDLLKEMRQKFFGKGKPAKASSETAG